MGLLRLNVVIGRVSEWWPCMIVTHKNFLDFVTGPGFSPTLCLSPLMCVCKFLLGKWSGFLYPLIVFALWLFLIVEGGRSGGVSPTLRIQGYAWPLPSHFCHQGWAHWTGLLNSEAWRKYPRSGILLGSLMLYLHPSFSNQPNRCG